MKIGNLIALFCFLGLQSCGVLHDLGIIDKHKNDVVSELGEQSSIPNHSVFDCKYIYHGTDYRINEYRIETDYRELFSYTHNQIKPYFTDGHFMECFSSVAQLGETNYLYLKIFFNTNQADKSYGQIVKSENLRITMMDGEKLYLEALTNSVAVKEKNKNRVVYDGIFAISKSELEALQKTEIDKLGIIWSYGYEEYDIKNIALIKKQLACLTQSLP